MVTGCQEFINPIPGQLQFEVEVEAKQVHHLFAQCGK